MLSVNVLRKIFGCFIVLLLIAGCSEKGEDRGSIIIGSVRSDGKVAETKIYVYPKGDHTKEVVFGYSGLDIYVPVGTYDLKVDWRGTPKWIENVKVEKYSKVQQKVVFPIGTLSIKSNNSDGTPADAAVLVTPTADSEKGIEAQKNDKGEIVAISILGKTIKSGEKEEEVMQKLNPEFKRSEPSKEEEGGEEVEIHRYRIMGANIDLVFSKSDPETSLLKTIIYDEKIAAGISNEGIEVNPGIYDVKVEHERITKWIRKVEVKDGEQTEESVVFPVGKIIINSEKPLEPGKDAKVAVYLEGRYDVMAKGGKVGDEISIVPGRYDILVTFDSKKIWFRGLEISDKSVMTKKINI